MDYRTTDDHDREFYSDGFGDPDRKPPSWSLRTELKYGWHWWIAYAVVIVIPLVYGIFKVGS